MADYNSMQAQAGLVPGGVSPMQMPTPSPAETALRLSSQAMQYQQVATQQMSSAMMLSQQFQQRYQQIQQQQSMSPYAAHAMSGMMPGSPQYQPGMLPSPITMTPPSSGVFRPLPAPAVAPIPPMYMPPNIMTPFTPRLPSPMFQSPYDQAAVQSDLNANRNFAVMSQVPGALGFGAGIAGGAYAGGRLGARFGPWGAVAGAGLGAAAAGFSGLAGGMQNLAQFGMGPTIEAHQMGAGIQNMSRNWVVQGPQLDATGRGLTRNASIQMAREVQDLAGNTNFKQQTGEMFNRQDLMQIMRQGGQAGLFDMAQEVPQIKQKLAETARTIRQFMELTNDPDVTNVIRQMGRMQQMGLNQQDMVIAAQGMRTYSRMAGTTVEGLQQIGGLPGAATFQGAGLTAGQGFQYGNYAAASARQQVASGGISPRQLALMGGVQGMAQRDIQAQAAFASMPLFAASGAQYGPQGWSAGGKGPTGGAFGMVNNAMANLNRGVQQGGIGALAMFPLQQREIADKMLSEMTPEEQQAQRFEMALSTGERLGMRGRAGMAAGARVLYGDDVAEQMMFTSGNPEAIRAQRQAIQRRQSELNESYRRQREEESPVLGGALRDIGRGVGLTGRGSWGAGVGRGVGKVGDFFSEGAEGIGAIAGDIGDAVGGLFKEETGTLRRRHRRGAAQQLAGLGRGGGRALGKGALGAGQETGLRRADIDMATLVGNMANQDELVGRTVTTVDALLDTVATIGTFGFITDAPDIATGLAGFGISMTTSLEDQRKIIQAESVKNAKMLNTFDLAKKVGGKQKPLSKAARAIEKAMGEKGKNAGRSVIGMAANKLDKIVYDNKSSGKKISDRDIEKSLREAMIEAGATPEEAAKGATDLMADPNIKAQIVSRGSTDSRSAEVWDKVQEGSMREELFGAITKATENRVEFAQEQREGVEDLLDLDKNLLGRYSDEEIQIQKLAASGDLAGLTALATMESGDQDDRSRKLWDQYRKLRPDMDEEALRKQFGKLDAGMLERLRDVGSRGDIADIQKYQESVALEASQTAFGSQGFYKDIGRHSAKFVEMLSDPGRTISAKDVAGAFTDKELRAMSQTRAGRTHATLLKKAQGTGKEAEEAQRRLAALAAEKADISEKGEETVDKVQAAGPEAEALQRSDAALANMEAMFSSFKPAAKDLAIGAKALRDAMESDAMRAALEG